MISYRRPSGAGAAPPFFEHAMPIQHPTLNAPSLQPKYVSRFSCLGPQCEDNCCREWHISLDKRTFTSYTDHPRFAKVVRINPAPRIDLNYGRIELVGEQQECPLLEDNLCSVHRDQGEGELSHTCFTYPRVWTEIGGQAEHSLELSCPEAARQALLAPDAFDFEEGSMRARAESIRRVSVHDGFSADDVNEVRYFAINLLRARELALWQRLAVLGLLCEALEEPVARKDGAGMRALAEHFILLLQDGALLDNLAPLQPDHLSQALVFAVLWEGIPRDTPNPTRRQVIDAVAAGLGADPVTGNVGAERLAESYRQGLARLPEALEAAPHLLEHYLLNEVFLNLFPFNTPSPFQSYRRLVARFGLLRLMLAARCNTQGPLPDAQALVQTVQVHYRLFSHNDTLARKVDAALSSGAWARLENLFTLLRA
jgi:lysine-N-methylase